MLAGTILVSVWLLISLGIAFSGLSDFLNEAKFKRAAIHTKCKVVATLQARYSPHALSNRAVSVMPGGVANDKLVIQYEVGDYVYQTQTKKTYAKIPEGDLDVFYLKASPEESMVDGHYTITQASYFQLIGGSLFAVLSVIFLTLIIF